MDLIIKSVATEVNLYRSYIRIKPPLRHLYFNDDLMKSRNKASGFVIFAF